MASDKNKKWMPEGSGVNPKPIATFLIILTIATAFVYVLIKGVLWGMDKTNEMMADAPASKVEPGVRKFPAEPRLQGAPEPGGTNPKEGTQSLLPLDDMREYKKKIEAAEKAAGWVAGQEGVEAHISIEDAKDIIAKRGLPLKTDAVVQEVAAAEKVRKQMNNADASAGRHIGK
jgi:hypothetical protein